MPSGERANEASPWIGREQVRAVLTSRLTACASGDGGVVVVEGDGGIGKSWVLERVATLAASHGIGVARHRSGIGDDTVPFAALIGALRDGMPTPPGSEDGGFDDRVVDRIIDRRFVLLERLRNALERRTRREPLVVLLDDLQWADPSSITALRLLVTQLETEPLLWVVARRTAPPLPVLDHVVDELEARGASRVVLEPLDASAVDALAVEVLGARPDGRLAAVLAAAGGSPFFVTRTLETLVADGAIAVADGVASLTAPLTTLRLGSIVEVELAALSPTARRLVTTAAAFGSAFSPERTSRLLGRSLAETVGAWTEAADARILVTDGSRLRFRHDLFREAVYDQIPVPLRPPLHREIAEALLAEGAPAPDVAPHLIASGELHDESTLAVIDHAALDVRRRDPVAAADLIAAAERHLAPDHPHRARMLRQAAELYGFGGRRGDVRAVVERASDLPPVDRASVRLPLALTLTVDHDLGAAREECVAALAVPALPADVTLAWLLLRAQIDTTDHRPDDAAAWIDRAGAVAAELGGDQRAVTVARCLVDLSSGSYEDVLSRLPAVGPEDPFVRHVASLRIQALLAAGRLTDADDELAAAAAAMGGAGTLPYWYAFRAQRALFAGELEEAYVHADAGRTVAVQFPTVGGRLLCEQVLAQVQARRGGDRLARAVLDGPVLERRWWVPVYVPEWFAAGAAFSDGDRDAARRHLVATLGPLACHGVHRLVDGGTATHVRFLRTVGLTDRAAVVAEAAYQRARMNPASASLSTAAQHVGASLDGDVDAIEDVAARWDRLGFPLVAVDARLDAAQALVRRGDHRRAANVLTEVVDAYAALGAMGSADLVKDAAGRSRRRRPTARVVRPVSGWESLTPAEVAVVRLVATGRTNREVADELFVSRFTVDTHLRHAFMKLGVSNRVELTRTALRHLDD